MAQLGTGNNPGSQYGCVIWPNLYPNYHQPFNSSIPSYYGSGVLPINNNSGSNSYTCGMLNHGFPGFPDDAGIDGPAYGTCYVEGFGYGSLRAYAIPTCTTAGVPLDNYTWLLILTVGFIAIVSIRNKIIVNELL